MEKTKQLHDDGIDDPFAAAFAVRDVPGRSLWVDAWRRLLKNRAAVVSGIIMATMFVMVVFGPCCLNSAA